MEETCGLAEFWPAFEWRILGAVLVVLVGLEDVELLKGLLLRKSWENVSDGKYGKNSTSGGVLVAENSSVCTTGSAFKYPF